MSRDRVCADPSMFEEVGTLPAWKRRSAVFERCRLEDVGLGPASRAVAEHTSVIGFALYRVLLDEGVDPDLARQTVLLFVYPRPTRAAALPVSPSLVRDPVGIRVRITKTAIELPGGPTLPVSPVNHFSELDDWLEREVEAAYEPLGEVGEIVVEADADAPASAVHDVLVAAAPLDIRVVAVLVEPVGLVVGRWASLGPYLCRSEV